MNDPRLTLTRDGVAASWLEGVAPAREYRQPTAMHCAVSAAAIRLEPDALSMQDDQLLFGEAFDVLLGTGDFALGQARRDGYVGYVAKAALAPGVETPTHWVSALRTYAFTAPDAKSAHALLLTMNSLVAADGQEGRFLHVPAAGWVFEGHLAPIGASAEDPAAIAEQFVGAPYQWGGRESVGLDCSGLIQQALYACGRACPRDTDMQWQGLGAPIERGDLARNDLVFWKGHVGLMLDGTRLLHATAFPMMTVIEPLETAVTRIAQEAGEPLGYRRL